jgi:hypothetical protein
MSPFEKKSLENFFDYSNESVTYQREYDFVPPRGTDSYSLTQVGSVERIEVYRRRLEMGFELFASPVVDEALAIEKTIAEQRQFEGDFDLTIDSSDRSRRRIR